MEEKIICMHCGEIIEEDDYDTINGEPICQECFERYCTTCDHCGAVIWDSDSCGDEYTTLCRTCYENHYTCCNECNCVIHYDNAYEFGGEYYCHEQMKSLSWSDFVMKITEPELIQYLKERRLYINKEITTEEEF